MLFVPGDSERKQQKALGVQADALILDLEDSVASSQRSIAHALVRDLLLSKPNRAQQSLWVRVNSLSSGLLLEDLIAVFPGAPDGLLLPKVSSPEQIVQVSHYLAALEARESRAPGATKLIAIVTETPQGLLNLLQYPRIVVGEPLQRLTALTWGMEDLSAALGATRKVDDSGTPTFTIQLARSLCLTAAAALGVQAVDSVAANFRDAAALEREIAAARRDGFSGKLAIHPDQVAAINSAFSPTESDLARARRVVTAFAASPEAGVLNLDGEMIDRPHLLQARRILAADQERASGSM